MPSVPKPKRAKKKLVEKFVPTTPTTTEIVNRLDELVALFKQELDRLRVAFQSEEIEAYAVEKTTRRKT